MAEYRIVGTVSVKVMPDTSEFGRRLRAYLKKVENTMEADVPVHLDKEKAEADAKVFERKLEEATDDKTATLHVRTDTRGLSRARRAFSSLDKMMDQVRDVKSKLTIDDDKLRGQLDGLREELTKTSQIKLSVNEDDLSSVRRTMEDLDRELSKRRTITRTVGGDTASLERVRNEYKRHLDQVAALEEDARRDRVNAERAAQERIDRDRLAAQRGVLWRVRDAMRQINTDLLPFDERELRKWRRDLEQKLTDRELLKLELETDLDPLSYRRVERQLEDLEDQLDAKVAPSLEDVALRYTQARLAWLSRMRFVSLVPRVNQAAARAAEMQLARLSGMRLGFHTLDNLWDFIKDIDKNLPLIGSLAYAVSGLSAWLLSAASNMFAMARSLAQIGPLFLTLPGIVMGFVIGIGASIAVLKEFNERIPELKRDLEALQDVMADNFWDVVEKPFRNLIDTLFPLFRKGILETTDALAGFFSASATSLMHKFDGPLVTMFDNLNESIEIATEGTDAYARILRNLGLVGSEELKSLADWWVRVTDTFDNWLEDAINDGRMAGWIEHAKEELNALGRVLRHTGGILRQTARAAERAGGSTLEQMARTLERAHEVTKGDRYQDGITRALVAAHTMMNQIATHSGKKFQDFLEALSHMMAVTLPIAGEGLGKLFGGIFDALGQDSVGRGLLLMFAGLRDAVEDIVPALGPFADGLGIVMTLIGELSSALGPGFAGILRTAGGAMVRLNRGLTPVIESLGHGFGRVVSGLERPVLALADGLSRIGTHSAAPLRALGDALGDIASRNGEQLARLIESLGESLGIMLPITIELATIALPPLAEVLGVVADTARLVLDVFNLLPEPLQTIMVTAGLAAIAWGRLSTAFTAATQVAVGEATMMQTAMAGVHRNMQGLTRGALVVRGAAGLAGLGMLSMRDSAEEVNSGLGIATTAASGAAIGFGVFGPKGALVGGVIGGLAGVASSFGSTSDAVDDTAEAIQRLAEQEAALDAWAASLKGTLDEVTGAMTEVTRETVTMQAIDLGFMDIAKDIGVSGGDIVNAMLGQTEAIYKVRGAVDDYTMGLERLSRADFDATVAPIEEMLKFIGATGDGIRDGGSDIREGMKAIEESARDFDLSGIAEESGNVWDRVKTDVTKAREELEKNVSAPMTLQLDDSEIRGVQVGLWALGVDITEFRPEFPEWDIPPIGDTVRLGLLDLAQVVPPAISEAFRSGRELSESEMQALADSVDVSVDAIELALARIGEVSPTLSFFERMAESLRGIPGEARQAGEQAGADYGLGFGGGLMSGTGGPRSLDEVFALVNATAAGAAAGDEFIDGMLAQLPRGGLGVAQAVGAIGADVVEGTRQGAERAGLGDMGTWLGTRVLEGLQTVSASAAGAALGSDAVSGLSGLGPLMSRAGGEGGNSFASGLRNAVAAAQAAAQRIRVAATSGMSIAGAMQSAGTSGAYGFASGLGSSGALAAIIGRARAMASAAVNTVRSILRINSPSRVFMGIGSDTAAGFVHGLESNIGALADSGRSMAFALRDSVAESLDIRSPSRVFRQLGIQVGRGMSLGIGSSMNQALYQLNKSRFKTTKAIRDFGGSLKSTLRDIDRNMKGASVDEVQNTMVGLLDSIADSDMGKAAKAQLRGIVQITRVGLRAVAKEYEDYARRHQAAKDMILSTREQFVDYGNITTVSQSQSFDGMLRQLQRARDSAVEYASVVEQLRKAGLNNDALNDLLEAGPDALRRAQEILGAGKAGIAQVNSLYHDLARAGRNAGESVATAMYGHGVDIANGLVNGLRAKRNALASEMDHMAKALTSRIKKLLGIKSPSRVFRDIGFDTSAGFALGIAQMSDLAVDAFDLGSLTEVGADALDGLVNGMESRHSALRKAVGHVEAEFDRITGSDSSHHSVTARASRMAHTDASEEGVVVKQFIYNAAPGKSFDAEEDLFEAVGRSRFGGF